jgi:phage recombination protein Bet
MTTALSKAEQNALSVSYNVLGTHVELDLQFVKKYLVRGKADFVSDQEIVLFMNTCQMMNLNPLVNGEVYLIKYSREEPAQMVVGKGAYMRKVFEHPNYLAKQDGITVKRGNEIVQKEGACLYPGEELVGGWCRVYFVRGDKERIAFKEVSMSEYNKGMANWKSKPATMINKVAISQCVREAFPKDYEGIYSEDELIASGAITADYEVVGDVTLIDPVINQEQRQQMMIQAKAYYGEEWKECVKNFASEYGLTSTMDMPTSVWDIFMQRMSEPVPQESLFDYSDDGDEPLPWSEGEIT